MFKLTEHIGNRDNLYWRRLLSPEQIRAPSFDREVCFPQAGEIWAELLPLPLLKDGET